MEGSGGREGGGGGERREGGREHSRSHIKATHDQLPLIFVKYVRSLHKIHMYFTG